MYIYQSNNLNTSYVDIKRLVQPYHQVDVSYLNTSYVDIKQISAFINTSNDFI